MRVLFHYTHKQTLGHTTRSVALVTALCRHGAEVLVLQGGLPQPFVQFPKNAKVLDLPLPFDGRGSFQAHAAPVSAAQRAPFILKTAADFKPDVFITEFFPFGRLSYTPELLPTLRFLRKKGVRILASIGYPLLIDLERFQDPRFCALHKSIFAFFDTFLIHTPDKLETAYIQKTIPSEALAKLYFNLLKELEPRTKYTGYVYPQPMISDTGKPRAVAKNKTVVISRGGGAVYPKLITLSIEAKRLLAPDIHLIIACGPATTAKEMALFQSCLKPKDQSKIFLTQRISDLDDYFKDCLASVSLCGYNTSVQLMRHGTPSVLVPYQNNLSRDKVLKTNTNDQIARARLLKERFCGLILDYDLMTASNLAEAITQQIHAPRPAPAPQAWFNGADLTARLVLEGSPN